MSGRSKYSVCVSAYMRVGVCDDVSVSASLPFLILSLSRSS